MSDGYRLKACRHDGILFGICFSFTSFSFFTPSYKSFSLCPLCLCGEPFSDLVFDCTIWVVFPLVALLFECLSAVTATGFYSHKITVTSSTTIAATDTAASFPEHDASVPLLAVTFVLTVAFVASFAVFEVDAAVFSVVLLPYLSMLFAPHPLL